jgi:SAM-dependent methyltransferase
MSIFRWTAPLFKFWGRRWTDDDFRCLAEHLREYVPTGGVIADVGGGTGELGTGLARHLRARAVIVDPTAAMLRRVDAGPQISVRLASAEALPFPDGYFDAVVVCDAFHHFSDQDAAAREMARVAGPGGGVLILEMAGTGRDRPFVVLEKILREPAGFRSPDNLRDFLAGHGIAGTSTRQGGSSYLFVGTVRDQASPIAAARR